jgi:hypothetical protein
LLAEAQLSPVQIQMCSNLLESQKTFAVILQIKLSVFRQLLDHVPDCRILSKREIIRVKNFLRRHRTDCQRAVLHVCHSCRRHGLRSENGESPSQIDQDFCLLISFLHHLELELLQVLRCGLEQLYLLRIVYTVRELFIFTGNERC